ncbi:cytochrome C assembly protein [Virgibacillus phasianinus]|uniref:Cytochrome C assembly protein n=1 Tax=Virgibacillus phasianinus TaxID=2017483 RepID=A0A220U5D1_9BACI|nr:cytochrome c biogenesis protein CcsA [Virgibacillus phasianinus]ASK63051.1 cytochrome C assembly protein [Virgibacillus phasianinus]
MFESRWLYEIILIIYGLSLTCYFIDFIQSNQKANRIAFWLLSMVWIIQSFFLCKQVFLENSFPILSLYDGLFFYSFVLVTLSLIINRLFSIHFIVFFTNLFGFFILLLYILTKAKREGLEQGVQLVNEILITHITLSIVSYGFFTLSFLLSIMYLVQYRLLKNKQGMRWIRRLGDLKQLDRYSFMAVTLGVPLLLLGIILGVVWAYVANEEFYWFDLKTFGSFLVLAVYVLYLLLRVIKRYQGKAISIYNTAAFLILIINFLLFSLLSNFHF